MNTQSMGLFSMFSSLNWRELEGPWKPGTFCLPILWFPLLFSNASLQFLHRHQNSYLSRPHKETRTPVSHSKSRNLESSLFPFSMLPENFNPERPCSLPWRKKSYMEKTGRICIAHAIMSKPACSS